MTLDIATLLRHAADSLRDPREQARWVMSHELPRGLRWQILIAISIVSTVLSVVLELLKTGNLVFLLGVMHVAPITGAIATVSNAVITVFLIYWAGRAFGGQGRFPDTISVVAWLQFILCCILSAQVVVALILSPLLGLTDFAALVALLWMFSHFVAELHGFRSAMNVFFATIAIAAGFVLALYALAALLGVAAAGGSL